MKMKSILYLLSITLLASGCIREDLSLCPDETSAVSLTLSCPEEVCGNDADRNIRRTDFYIFDPDGRFVCSKTDASGPFGSDYACRIPLPAGDYRVVGWTNINDSLDIAPAAPVAGVTTLREFSLSLRGLTPSSLPLYHGTTGTIRVQENRITHATVPLRRNTKNIKLSVRFVKSDGTPSEDIAHLSTPVVLCYDGILSFDNSLLPSEGFHSLPAVTEQHTGGDLDALFHKMTLRTGQEDEILLLRPAKARSVAPSVFYRESLQKLLAGTGYDTQEKLDGTHSFDILLRFTLDEPSDDPDDPDDDPDDPDDDPSGDPDDDPSDNPSDDPSGGGASMSVRIWINGWEYVEFGDDL